MADLFAISDFMGVAKVRSVDDDSVTGFDALILNSWKDRLEKDEEEKKELVDV